MNKFKISVVGLGYVGLPLAIEFGKIFDVIGYDKNSKRVNELRNGIDSTLEVSNNQFQLSNKLVFTDKLNDIQKSNIFIITVPTPVDKTNRPDLSFLKRASKDVGKFLKKKDIVIYESTVYPGVTEEICVPILSAISGLEYNKDFFCGYSPERINPGDKIKTLTKVTKITSGSTREISKIVDNLYKKIIKAGTYKASSIKVAEAAKVIENSQRDLNIAFVNELSVIFNRINIDTMEVLNAASTKWNFLNFKPGMVGGHCIGVDPYYLTFKAEAVGYNPQVILAGRRLNDNMSRYSARNVIKLMALNKINISNCTVGVMGITFKENCPDIRNSKAFDLVNELKLWGINVKIFDEWASNKDLKKEFNETLTKKKDFKDLDSIIVAVGHNEFRKKQPHQLIKLCKKGIKPVLGDIKSLYNKEECENIGFSVFRL